nr:hypothetical protein [uncultured Desulfobacter sp.]
MKFVLRITGLGFTLKNCIAKELVSAIRLVAKGQVYISPEIAGTILDGYLSRSVCKNDTNPSTNRKR